MRRLQRDDANNAKNNASHAVSTASKAASGGGNAAAAANTTTAGSFLRLSTHPTQWSLGQPLTPHLLRSRYIPLNSTHPDHAYVADPTTKEMEGCYVNTAQGDKGEGKKMIELWGEAKVRERQQLEHLEKVSLRSMGINGVLPRSSSASRGSSSTTPPSTTPATDGGEDQDHDQGEDQDHDLSAYAHLTDLDLAGNLLGSWDAALQLLARFPNLTKVGLAGNRLGDYDDWWDLEEGGKDDGGNASDEGKERREGDCGKEGGEEDMPSFPKMRVLNLNGTAVGSFRTAAWLLGGGGDGSGVCPNLEELCLAHSDLSDLDCFDVEDDVDADTNDNADRLAALSLRPSPPRPIEGLHLSHLRFLDLSDCRLTSWRTQIGRLALPSTMPLLTDLVLNDNPSLGVIERFDSDDKGDDDGSSEVKEDGAYFPSLTTLQLTNAGIASWSSIDALRDIFSSPKTSSNNQRRRQQPLRSLRFRNNPVTSPMSAAEARAVTIARLPDLEYLNGSPVGSKERTDAERRYVAAVAREVLLAEAAAAAEVEGSSDDHDHKDKEGLAAAKKRAILAAHPRFEELTAKHRDAMAAARASAAMAASGGGSLSHDAINVTIRSMAASSCGAEPLRRRLPGSLAVGRVKLLCSRAFGLDVDLQTLHFRSGDGAEAFPTELDDDENALSYYGVADGAEILMNEVDVEARRRDAEREKALQDQRIEEQERTATALQAAQTKGFEVKA